MPSCDKPDTLLQMALACPTRLGPENDPFLFFWIKQGCLRYVQPHRFWVRSLRCALSQLFSHMHILLLLHADHHVLQLLPLYAATTEQMITRCAQHFRVAGHKLCGRRAMCGLVPLEGTSQVLATKISSSGHDTQDKLQVMLSYVPHSHSS